MILASVGRDHVPCENLEEGGRKTTLNATRSEAQRSAELGVSLMLGVPAPGLHAGGAAHRGCFFFLVVAGRSSPGPWANGQRSEGRTQPSG